MGSAKNNALFALTCVYGALLVAMIVYSIYLVGELRGVRAELRQYHRETEAKGLFIRKTADGTCEVTLDGIVYRQWLRVDSNPLPLQRGPGITTLPRGRELEDF